MYTEGNRGAETRTEREECHPERREREKRKAKTQKTDQDQKQRQQGTRRQGSGEREPLDLADEKNLPEAGCTPEAGGLGEAGCPMGAVPAAAAPRAKHPCRGGEEPVLRLGPWPTPAHISSPAALCMPEEENWRSKSGQGPLISPWTSHLLLLLKTFIYLFSCAAQILVS